MALVRAEEHGAALDVAPLAAQVAQPCGDPVDAFAPAAVPLVAPAVAVVQPVRELRRLESATAQIARMLHDALLAFGRHACFESLYSADKFAHAHWASYLNQRGILARYFAQVAWEENIGSECVRGALAAADVIAIRGLTGGDWGAVVDQAAVSFYNVVQMTSQSSQELCARVRRRVAEFVPGEARLERALEAARLQIEAHLHIINNTDVFLLARWRAAAGSFMPAHAWRRVQNVLSATETTAEVRAFHPAALAAAAWDQHAPPCLRIGPEGWRRACLKAAQAGQVHVYRFALEYVRSIELEATVVGQARRRLAREEIQALAQRAQPRVIT